MYKNINYLHSKLSAFHKWFLFNNFSRLIEFCFKRRCRKNAAKTCACQGPSPDKQGSSYSLGCSYAVYKNGCKFGKINDDNDNAQTRKFKFKNKDLVQTYFYKNTTCQTLESCILNLFCLLTKTWKSKLCFFIMIWRWTPWNFQHSSWVTFRNENG